MQKKIEIFFSLPSASNFGIHYSKPKNLGQLLETVRRLACHRGQSDCPRESRGFSFDDDFASFLCCAYDVKAFMSTLQLLAVKIINSR